MTIEYYIKDANTGKLVKLSEVLPRDYSISGVATPTNSPRTGQKRIRTTGTAERLADVNIQLPGGTVYVTVHSAATFVTIGKVGVNNLWGGMGNGACVEQGDTRAVITSDLSSVYINGTAGDWVSWSAG